MTVTEIKKALYKNPINATLIWVKKDTVFYVAQFNEILLTFYIPLSDIGDGTLEPVEPAKHLIRWMSIPYNVV